jgi:hypothetical protein
MFICVIRDIETNVSRVLREEDEGTTLDLDRNERHSIPVTTDADWILLGIHRPDRLCPCGPHIIKDGYDYEIVVHRETVN